MNCLVIFKNGVMSSFPLGEDCEKEVERIKGTFKRVLSGKDRDGYCEIGTGFVNMKEVLGIDFGEFERKE